MTEPPGTIDGAKNAHQNRHAADSLKAIGMCCQSAHGMESDRVAGDMVVFFTPGIGPRDGQLDLLITCGNAHLVGKTPDGFDRNTGNFRCPFRGIVFDTVD